jgi:hypothetical protein
MISASGGASAPAARPQQLLGHGQPEGDGLARPGLRGDDQVAPARLVLEHGGLNRRGRGIATRGKRFRRSGGRFSNVMNPQHGAPARVGKGARAELATRAPGGPEIFA